MTENNKANKLTSVLFLIYLLALVWILLFKLGVHFSYMGTGSRINLIPFDQSVIRNGIMDMGEIIMNILIFIPLGMYVGILFKLWIIWKRLFFFFLVSFLIEVCQYMSGLGMADITDIINNTLGGSIGLMIYTGIEKALKSSGKANKFINILATSGTVFMLLFLFLLKTNRLWIRYQ